MYSSMRLEVSFCQVNNHLPTAIEGYLRDQFVSATSASTPGAYPWA